MKIKIRKVEVNAEEFALAVEEMIKVHEDIPKSYNYRGTTVLYICKNMGIKEFDFWNIYTNNTRVFGNRIEVIRRGQSDVCVLYRSETLKAVKEDFGND